MYLTYLRSAARLKGGKDGPMSVSCETFTEGRKHLKQLIDAAEAGLPASLRRDHDRVALVDVDRYLSFLRQAIPDRVEVVPEADGWSVFLPDSPIAGEGRSFDEALDDMVVALREYAEDWEERLRLAPNHHGRWALVQLIALSDDAQLKDWVVGEER